MPDANSDLAVGFGTPFEAQIAFLRNKLRLPTERWDDIQRSAHDRAFMVAGAAKADLLADLQKAVVDRAADGGGLQAFRKDFKEIVAKNGWTGWTGEGSKAGEAWRTRVIYQTNMATSYAAGRYQQMTDPEVLKLHPYWRYIHSDGVQHPRPQHLAWHGLTLPHDHPFWATHFPPNGWGCQCRITSVSAADGLSSAHAGLGEPPKGWDKVNPKTGAQDGIDKGFDYTPGTAVNTPLRQFVQDKMIVYPDAIAKALAADINRYVSATETASAFTTRVLADRSVKEPLFLGFVENSEAINAVVSADVKGYMVLLPADAPRHIADHHGTDGGSQRPATPADYALISTLVNEADLVSIGKTERGMERLEVRKLIDGELFKAIFEVRPGKRNKALSLVTLVIKTAK